MEEKKTGKKKIVILFLLIAIMCLAFALVFLYNNTEILNISKKAGTLEEMQEVDYSEYEEIGENAYISSAVITKTATGVGPWDDESETDSSNEDETVTWTAGDDWSADDEIVRSFDQITWTVENTFALKSSATVENYKGGVIYIEASVPEELAGLVEWDVDSMAWAENATVSDDGTVFTGYYTMSDSDKTVPGKQNLVLVLQIYNAINGTEIVPTFKVNLYGNDEEDIVTVVGDTAYVSAVGRYNIAIAKNGYVNYSGYFDLETGQEVDSLTDTSVRGRMQGYGIVVELYNNNTSKELKGIELPQGNIEFDIVLSESLSSNGGELTDSEYTPILWDYKENVSSGNSRILGQKHVLGKSFKFESLCRWINSIQ